MSELDELLHDNQAIMLVYSGEILGADHFKRALRAEIDAKIREAMEPKPLPTKYGCHCDLAPHQQPDKCVMDAGDYVDCCHAIALHNEGKTKLDCGFWRPITFHGKTNPPSQ